MAGTNKWKPYSTGFTIDKASEKALIKMKKAMATNMFKGVADEYKQYPEQGNPPPYPPGLLKLIEEEGF